MTTLRYLSLLLAGLLAACAGTLNSPTEEAADTLPQKPLLTYESDLFGEPVDIIPIADVFRLSEEQQAAFRTYYQHPLRQDIPSHKRVFDYLKTITMNFGYRGETLTAEQALSQSSGNCLSLAIVTTALARLAGVNTGYQLMNSAPVFASREHIVFKGQHVRTKLFAAPRAGNPGEVFFRRRGLTVDYFPSAGDRFIGNLSEEEYHAMYYNNLASEAISRAEYDTAFWLLRQALELTPDNVDSINSMAIVYRRAGDAGKAEEIYRHGIDHLPTKVSLLRNYRVLLLEQGRLDEAGEIDQALAELNEHSPFDWLHAGQDAYDNGDFRDAISFYKKAVEIAPYLHESYAGMAKAHYRLGNRSSARRELLKARQHAHKPSVQSLYQAKLTALGSS